MNWNQYSNGCGECEEEKYCKAIHGGGAVFCEKDMDTAYGMGVIDERDRILQVLYFVAGSDENVREIYEKMWKGIMEPLKI